MLAHVIKRECAFADSWVVNHHAAFVHFAQYHEVVQIPVQDARGLHMREFVQFNAQRTAGHAHRLRDLDQPRQGGTFEREREPAAQGRHLRVLTVITGNHRQTSQTAFRRLTLADHRQASASAEMQANARPVSFERCGLAACARNGFVGFRFERGRHQPLPVMRCPIPYSGSKIHSIMRRRSSSKSASKLMPGFNDSG